MAAFHKIVLLACFIFASTISQAEDWHCRENLGPVGAYLRSHPQSSLLELAGLADTDQNVWRRAGLGLCPGIAVAHLSGDQGAQSYSAIVRDKSGGQSLILITPSEKERAWTVTPITSYSHTEGYFTWTVRPGTFSSKDGSVRVLKNDSIAYGDQKGAAAQFYLLDGKVQSFQPAR